MGILEGKHKEQYENLVDYANLILVINPSSRAICQTIQQLVEEGIDPKRVFEIFC